MLLELLSSSENVGFRFFVCLQRFRFAGRFTRARIKMNQLLMRIQLELQRARRIHRHLRKKRSKTQMLSPSMLHGKLIGALILTM
jgi:hypothetical protein